MGTKRRIIEIDDQKCDGCGQCVSACHEGAIALVDGKARLVSETFCDGLGACIGECPQGAINILEREADDFDAEAVARHLAAPAIEPVHRRFASQGCPGSALRTFAAGAAAVKPGAVGASAAVPEAAVDAASSQLGHWPVQLMLVPPQAPFLRNADLLVCADCVPFTVPDFHVRYLAGRAVLVGCPTLDDLGHYAERLAQVMQVARPQRLTVLRMEVPCCRGLSEVAVRAAEQPGLRFPVEEHVIGVRGGIVERRVLRE